MGRLGRWRTVVWLWVFAAAFVLVVSCVPEPVAAVFAAADLRPPAVASWGPAGGAEVVIVFDEEIEVAGPGFASTPGPGIVATRVGEDDQSVIVTLDGGQLPGAAYAVSGVVSDMAGNLSSFVLPYWGFNPDPPLLMINELITEGTTTHPDAVELFVVEGGNCAGLAFFVGSPDDFDVRYLFPALVVEAGDYIILHLKPQALEAETDEVGDKGVSGGIDANAAAWDLWYHGGDGALSGKNCALSLCASPRGAVLDAVLYSERTVESDINYGGFGTAVLRDRVAALVAAGAWSASDPPRPEDCARSTGTTSTRSICRSSDSADTDAGTDWHIVPTKGATLGAVNVDEVYAP